MITCRIAGAIDIYDRKSLMAPMSHLCRNMRGQGV